MILAGSKKTINHKVKKKSKLLRTMRASSSWMILCGLSALFSVSILGFKPQHTGKLWKTALFDTSSSPVDPTIYDKEIAEFKKTLLLASDKTNNVPPLTVINAIKSLEKLYPKRNALDNGATTNAMRSQIDGAWRLIFTTGTAKLQKDVGRIDYFPLKAVQTYNIERQSITNGIYVGNFPVLKFLGTLQWNMKLRKLEYIFYSVIVLGIKFRILPEEGSRELTEDEKKKKKSFTSFARVITVDADFAATRGAGGGLALFKRDREMEIQMQDY